MPAVVPLKEEVAGLLTYIVPKPVQPENALFPILVIVEWIDSDDKPVQFKKAPIPMLFTDDGIETDVICVLPAKALAAIEVMLYVVFSKIPPLSFNCCTDDGIDKLEGGVMPDLKPVMVAVPSAAKTVIEKSFTFVEVSFVELGFSKPS